MPGKRSLNSTVPPVVPSLVHSSQPVAGSQAPKNSLPSKATGAKISDLGAPGKMSLTRVVVAADPPVFQSSRPAAPLFATKKVVPAATTKSVGLLSGSPGFRSPSRNWLNDAPTSTDIHGSRP